MTDSVDSGVRWDLGARELSGCVRDWGHAGKHPNIQNWFQLDVSLLASLQTLNKEEYRLLC
jgi:hypothetical protein